MYDRERVIARVAFLLMLLAPAPLLAQEKQRAAEQEGVKLYEEGDFEAAKRKLLEAAEGVALLSEPEQVLVHKYLGYCEVVIGNPEAAKPHFRRALKLDPELALDPSVVPPKIVAVFDEVRAEFAPLPATRALALSAMAPGLGQWSTGRKGPAIAFGAGTVAMLAISANYVVQASKADGFAADAGPAVKDDFRKQADEYAMKRNVALGLTALVWGAAAFDAYRGARKQPKLRVGIAPGWVALEGEF